MNKRLISLLVLTTIASGSLSIGQVIRTPESRESILSGMEDTLANQDRSASKFEKVKSPFVAIVPKTQPSVQKVVEVVEAEVSEVLPDGQALAAVAKSFNPLGSLILGNRGVLQIQNNRTIEKGATFTAEIKGNNYEVLVSDVTEHGYTLQLGDAKISKNFLTTSGTAK